jgi:hypothetical protein
MQSKKTNKYEEWIILNNNHFEIDIAIALVREQITDIQQWGKKR